MLFLKILVHFYFLFFRRIIPKIRSHCREHIHTKSTWPKVRIMKNINMSKDIKKY
jgi:hypothetical protein